MKKRITSKHYFQTMNLVYYMQVVSLLLFGIVVMFLIMRGNKSDAPAADAQWVYVLPIVLIVALATSYFLFRALVSKIEPSLKLQDKLPKYSSAVIVRSALLELPGLFSAIVAYMTFEIFYLGATALILLAMMIMRPSRQSVTEDINLSQKERALLDNPEAVVSEV
jgi:hypothetical protein